MRFPGSVWTIVGFGEKEPENLHIVQRKCVLPRFFHSRQLRCAAVVRAHGVAPQTFCPGDVDGGTRFAAAQALRGGVRIRVFKGKAVEIFHCFGDGGGTARIFQGSTMIRDARLPSVSGRVRFAYTGTEAIISVGGTELARGNVTEKTGVRYGFFINGTGTVDNFEARP